MRTIFSAFNIASLMVANVNNNNNNNNINDNDSNANEDNINESNTNANVMSMVMVGLGGRAFNYTKRSIQVCSLFKGRHKKKYEGWGGGELTTKHLRRL